MTGGRFDVCEYERGGLYKTPPPLNRPGAYPLCLFWTDLNSWENI